MKNDPKVLEVYAGVSTERRMRDLNVAYIVAIVLMPMGYTIDYIVYGDKFTELSILRTISIGLLLIAYGLYKFQKNIKLHVVFETLWAVLLLGSLCGMIYITDGVLSPYYAALNLVIIASTFLMPLTLRMSLVVFLIAVIFYVVTITLHNIPVNTLDGTPLYNNLYFIVLTGIIGAVASHFNEKNRITEFSLRYELDQRNKELAELDRMKSDFFANISHELRTPLTLILSPVEDLLHSDQPFDLKVTRLLSTVRDNSYRLLKLVNDLLSIVRLDERDQKLECKPTNLHELLQSTIKSMSHLAKSQKIDLQVKTDLSPAIINSNVNALEKIFINLINNAIKFTHENGEIHVKTVVDDDNVTITIRDTGIGISKEDLPHIFTRFQQADSSATRKFQGTGLGLALVRELTIALNGKVDVKSKLDKGTIFTLTFPLIEETVKLLVDDSPTAPVSQLEIMHQKADYVLQLNRPDTKTLVPAPRIKNNTDNDSLAKLLIVEDEPDLRTYLVNTLGNEYQVYSASDGKAGLDLFNRHHPDIVLTDLMLPEIDGLELCKTIKHDKTNLVTKVILLTARIDDESKLTALKNGADDFLTKPFSTTELRTRLSNLWASMQLEKDLDKQNKELSQALTDLKAAESKLLHSEKLNAIGSLAAGLLHEVNNPLNYTITAAQLLKRDNAIRQDDDLAETVDDIVEGMERIRVIVRDLRTFAYPDEADKQQPFVLLDAIQSALRFTASEKGNTDIQVNIPNDLVVEASQNHIVQVMINLITNAIKAVQNEEKPQIIISAKTSANSSTDNSLSEQRVLVSVHDNGMGIDENAISRIFEPFYTTRDVGDGLGMGLSICHTIIKNHGGNINVESKAGQFTRFSFDLALLTT